MTTELPASQTNPEQVNRPLWQVHLVLLFVQITFGGFHVSAKYVLGFMPSLAVVGVRVMVATPVLMLLAWFVDRTIPARRDLPYLALLGFLGVFVNQIFFIKGLQYTTATNAAIFMPSIPVFAVAAAAVLGIERMSMWRVVGVILAVAGAVVMLDLTNVSLKGSSLGNLLILTNCFAYSMFIVLQRPLLRRLPPLTVIAWSFLFGGSGVLLVAFPTMAKVDFTLLPSKVFLFLGYIIFFPTVINYSLNTWAIRHSTPTLSATYTTLQPIATATLATIFLGEVLGWRQGAGFALIMAGLAAVTLGSRRLRRAQKKKGAAETAPHS